MIKTEEEIRDDRHYKEVKELKEGISTITKTADSAIGKAFDDIKKQFNDPKDFRKWEELSGRLLNATISGDTRTIESLKKDLHNLAELTIPETDNNVK